MDFINLVIKDLSERKTISKEKLKSARPEVARRLFFDVQTAKTTEKKTTQSTISPYVQDDSLERMFDMQA